MLDELAIGFAKASVAPVGRFAPDDGSSWQPAAMRGQDEKRGRELPPAVDRCD